MCPPLKPGGRPSRVAIALIRGYQQALSPWLGGHCRFAPSCSVYGIEAIERFGLGRGGWLTLRRLVRCQPWGGQGSDPVPHDYVRWERP